MGIFKSIVKNLQNSNIVYFKTSMLTIIYFLLAVALYLADQWWAIDDIVKTSVPSREGLKQVRTLGERVVKAGNGEK